jgi:hypothetical protein
MINIEEVLDNLLIVSNSYKRLDQYQGNGLNPSEAVICINGKNIKIYPKLGTFYLEEDDYIVDRISIISEDQGRTELPEIWLKYAKKLLTRYESKNI